MKKAAALSYKKSDNAPKLVAKGAGEIAERIIQIAKEEGIEIVEDRALVEVLSKLELESEIPPELYEAVAKILAYIYRKKKSYKGVLE